MKKMILILIAVNMFGCMPIVSKIPKGVNKQKILIKSEPTKARIYLNDEYLGVTPVKTKLWYEKEKFINIKAEPIYPNQFPQNLYFKIPPIPPKLVIYMDYQAKAKYEFEKAKKSNIAEPKPKEEIAEIKIIKEQIPAILPTIYFETDKFEIQKQEIDKIQFLTELLQGFPKYNISIHAHADIRGSIDYNQDLSEKRGNAVKEKLIEMGISVNRIKVFVHGEQRTINEEKKEVNYKYNRSVDFRLHK